MLCVQTTVQIGDREVEAMTHDTLAHMGVILDDFRLPMTKELLMALLKASMERLEKEGLETLDYRPNENVL